MNIFYRIILAVYAVCLSILSVIVMLVSLKPDIFDEIYLYAANHIISNKTALLILFIISFLFFILSLTFLLSGLKHGKDKKSVGKHTSIGEIRISLNSIENIALNASRRLNGVREIKAGVEKRNEGVSITIRIVAMPEINLPALSEEIQAKVKISVEESSGVLVSDVRVFIEGIYSGTAFKPRVE